MSGDIVVPRSEIQDALVQVGQYTQAQAQAIFHEWVAPMNNNNRLTFLRMICDGDVNRYTALGVRVLVTSHGW